jgi:shikimate dehydrogenase
MKSQCITGATRSVALLGNPVAHSLSPLIHNHVYATLGLPFVYTALAVRKEDLHSVIASLRACTFAGANVTIPHKQAAIPYCDVISPLSQLTGTVNTLYFKDNLLYGTTTDYAGFLRALHTANKSIKGAHIVILGNGGTARTLGFAIAADNVAASVTLVGRDLPKVSTLASEIKSGTGFEVMAESFLSDNLQKTMTTCTLLVNCTSVGMHPNTGVSPVPGELLHKNMYVFDAIYNPAQTELLMLAEIAGCEYQNGLRMLVYQALASCEYWIGEKVAEDVIDIEELQGMVGKDIIGQKINIDQHQKINVSFDAVKENAEEKTRRKLEKKYLSKKLQGKKL